LQVVDTQPDSPERARQELALQLDLGPPLLGTAGPGSEELSHAFLRARELCDRVGTAPQLFQTLFLLVHHHANQGRPEVALDLTEQLLEVVESAEEPLPAVMAYWARGFALISLCKLTEGVQEYERVISLYDPAQHSSLAHVFGMDPAVGGLAMSAGTLWTLGYLDRAKEYSRRSVAHARDLNHPTTLTHALLQSVVLSINSRDAELLPEKVDELVRHSTEHGNTLFRTWGNIYEGWLLSEQGHHDAAITRMRQGIADSRATGSELGQPWALWYLAEAHRRAGRVEEALAAVDEGISMAERIRDQAYEPELHRSRGKLLLERDPNSAQEAEACFRRAIEMARSQCARSLELRATISMSRLLRAQGRRFFNDTATTEIYTWFSEGLDTPDLVDAAALLNELL
jgi:predicted ATPase